MQRTKRIFIAATRQNDGKTTLSIGLIMALKKRFRNVGFIKPIGQRYLIEEGYKVDEDSVLVEEICGIKCCLKDMSPIAIEKGFTEWYIKEGRRSELVNKIRDSFNKVSDGMDIVVIEGTGHAGVGACFDLSNASVAKLLEAPVILVTSGGIGRPIDEVMLNRALFEKEGVDLKGVVVNKVLSEKYNKIKELVKLGLQKKGIRVYGVIPYKRYMSAPTMTEVIEEIKGKLLCGKENINNIVDKTLVGAMEPHEALHYIEDNSLIITPGDREDIILAATGVHLSQDKKITISGILLSGGLIPHTEILKLVKKAGIPMISVKGDTYSVASKVHDMMVKIKPNDKAKIDTAINLIEEYVDIDSLIEGL